MEQFTIELSGKGGLSKAFASHTDSIKPITNLIVAKEPNELVDGLFNQYLRDGYLAPTVSTTTAITTASTPTTALTSVEYNPEDDEVYWGDGVNKIHKGTSLTSTSLSTPIELIVGTAGYDKLYDIQMYEVNGIGKVMFVGRGAPDTLTSPIVWANQITATGWAGSIINVRPSGSVKPAILGTARTFNASGATSTTLSVTSPTGTDRVMFVIAYSTGKEATAATFNSVPMTQFYTQSASAGQPGYSIFRLSNPDVTTADVVVTYPSSAENRLVYVVITDNTDQSNNSFANGNRKTAANSTGVISFGSYSHSIKQLSLVSLYSAIEIVVDREVSLSNTIYSTTTSFGRDILAVTETNGYGLLFGFANTPLTSIDYFVWYSTSVNQPGGFVQELKGDYAFMRVADNGFAYVFADNRVHKYNGTISGGNVGTITKDVLRFPDTFRISDAVDFRSNLYIGVHQYSPMLSTTTDQTFVGRCGIYVWDRESIQFSRANFVELPGVREIKKIYASPENVIKLITISNSGVVELRQFGYNDSGSVIFPVKMSLGIGAFPQLPDGLTVTGDKAIWLSNDGTLYCEKDNLVSKLHEVKALQDTTAGAMGNIVPGAVFFGSGNETASTGFRSNKQAISYSYLDGGTHYLKKVYPFDIKNGGNNAQTPHKGDVYTGVYLLPGGSNIRRVRIYNAPIANGGTDAVATIKLYFNQGTSATMPGGMTKTITKSEAKRGYVDLSINSHNVHAIQIKLEWNTSVPLGEDTYMPSNAVVLYEPTTAMVPDNE